jgi:hypothetical protein
MIYKTVITVSSIILATEHGNGVVNVLARNDKAIRITAPRVRLPQLRLKKSEQSGQTDTTLGILIK